MVIERKWLGATIYANSRLSPTESGALAGKLIAELRKLERRRMKLLGRKGGKQTKARHDPEYFRRVGKLGGRPTSKGRTDGQRKENR